MTQHTYTQVQRETHLHEINTVTGGPEAHISWSHVREPFKVAEVTLTPSVWYNAELIWILLPRPEFESWPLLCNLGQVNKMHQGYRYNWKKQNKKPLPSYLTGSAGAKRWFWERYSPSAISIRSFLPAMPLIKAPNNLSRKSKSENAAGISRQVSYSILPQQPDCPVQPASLQKTQGLPSPPCIYDHTWALSVECHSLPLFPY